MPKTCPRYQIENKYHWAFIKTQVHNLGLPNLVRSHDLAMMCIKHAMLIYDSAFITSWMPEYWESFAHYLLFLWFFTSLCFFTSFKLLALWADASKAEAVGAQDGHVYILEGDRTIMRGINKAQAPLFPPQLVMTKDWPHPPSIQSLELQGVATTSWAIVLNLGGPSLKVSILAINIMSMLDYDYSCYIS